MKLFKQNKLISELMTKLANEQITSELLRKEVTELKDEIVKFIDMSIDFKNKTIQAQRELDFERQVSRRLIQESKEVAQLKHDLENMRIIAERFEEELNTSRKAVAFESELSRRLMDKLEEGE